MDRPGVRQVPEGSGEQGKMEETGCEVICGAPTTLAVVPAGSPSRGGNVAVYVFDINQPSLLTPFYSALVYISAFMALSSVLYFTNFPDNSPLSPFWSYFCLFGPFNYIYLFMEVFFSPDLILFG